jgi:riboflavin kinase/FMN adenylyltransferase
VAVVRGSTQYTGAGSIVTIGNFDGVHRGHRALLAAARQQARALDATGVCAYTFDPPPRDVLRPDNGIRRLQRLEDRVALLHEQGADDVLVEPFDRAFAAKTPEWFATEVLVGRLKARGVVVGHDFRFGRGRSGDADGLRSLLAAHDVPVHQVQAVQTEGAELSGAPLIISSSEIRTRLANGDVEGAAVLLARPHDVVGEVVHGEARGRDLGFPTANIAAETPLVPANGVYACRVLEPAALAGRAAVVNVGVRPTFEAAGAPATVEVHVLDWSGDLYGQTLRVGFVKRLRGERAFDGLDALVAQIRRDVDATRAAVAP